MVPGPHNPQQQRYWNGSSWTDHTHVPEVAPTSPPPFAPPPPPGGSVAAYGNPIQINASAALLVATGAPSGAEETFQRAVPLFNLLNVVTGVAPRDNGLLRTSMRASDGRFWAVLGRILVLSLVVAAVFIPLGVLIAILIAVGALAAGSGDPSIAD